MSAPLVVSPALTAALPPGRSLSMKNADDAAQNPALQSAFPAVLDAADASADGSPAQPADFASLLLAGLGKTDATAPRSHSTAPGASAQPFAAQDADTDEGLVAGVLAQGAALNNFAAVGTQLAAVGTQAAPAMPGETQPATAVANPLQSDEKSGEKRQTKIAPADDAAQQLQPAAMGAAAIPVLAMTSVAAQSVRGESMSSPTAVTPADGKRSAAGRIERAEAKNSEPAAARDQGAVKPVPLSGRTAPESIAGEPSKPAPEVSAPAAHVQADPAQAPRFDIAPAHIERPAAASAPSVAIPHPVGTHQWNDQFTTQVTLFATQVTLFTARKESQAEILVNPPDLGPIAVRLEVAGDKVSVAFAAAPAETRQAIQDALPQLREMLSQQGLSLGNASVGAESSPREFAAAPYRSSGGGGGSGEPAPAVPARAALARGLVDTFA